MWFKNLDVILVEPSSSNLAELLLEITEIKLSVTN